MAKSLIRMGRADEAIAAAKRYVEAASPVSQLEERWQREVDLARIYAHARRPRECVEVLARLLRVASRITVPMLRADPAWDDVRDDAGFKALLADPKNNVPL